MLPPPYKTFKEADQNPNAEGYIELWEFKSLANIFRDTSKNNFTEKQYASSYSMYN